MHFDFPQMPIPFQNDPHSTSKVFMKSMSSSFVNDGKHGLRGVIKKKEMYPDKNGKMIVK